MATTAVLRHRRDTAANWTSNNPVLQAGQLGYETDTLKFKFGDGTTTWASLTYANGQELNELHDVLIVSATADNVLMYDSVSSLWKNRSAGYLSTLITGFASASHAHSTGDITSGIFAPSFLGSGSPSSTNFLRGDGSWAAPTGGGIALAAGTQTGTSGTINFANSNGITFGMSGSNQITASYTVPTQSVQTQASGNIVRAGFSSTTTTGVNIVGTNNSLGLSLGIPAYLTTQSVQTQASGNIARTGFTSTTTTGTAIVGTLDTNGLNLGVPAYLTTAAGGGGVAIGASTQTATSGTVIFSNSNGVSFGLNNGTLTASVPGSNATSSLVGINGISISTSGSTISISNAQFTLSGYNHYNDVVLVAGQAGQGTLNFDPINLANPVQMDRFAQYIFNSNATNSSGSHTVSFWIGLYTKNISTLSLFQSTSTSFAVSHSGTAGSYASYSGMRLLSTPFTTTLSANDYWIGVVSSSSSAGANGSYSLMLQSNINTNFAGLWNAAANSTIQAILGQGVYSAATAGLPGSVAFSQIQGSNSNVFRPPVVVLVSGTV